jgi:hypothetical protein
MAASGTRFCALSYICTSAVVEAGVIKSAETLPQVLRFVGAKVVASAMPEEALGMSERVPAFTCVFVLVAIFEAFEKLSTYVVVVAGDSVESVSDASWSIANVPVVVWFFETVR